jgi:hypothetical protein
MQRLTRKAVQNIAGRTPVNAMINATSRMTFLTKSTNISAHNFNKIVSAGSVRNFSALPYHVKLEMPNLSPTMEKVSSTPYHHLQSFIVDANSMFAVIG